MTANDAIQWLQELATRQISARISPGRTNLDDSPVYYSDTAATTGWTTEVHAALESVFPTGHAVLRQWTADATIPGGHHRSVWDPEEVDAAKAVVTAAISILKNNRLSTLLDGVRAESLAELLDQAARHLASKEVVAATVLAGGALETQLRDLCARFSITVKGEPSIGKYDQAIGEARNVGTKVPYQGADSKQVLAWGADRNDAAHTPMAFNRSPDDIKRMIEGIRSFVARTA